MGWISVLLLLGPALAGADPWACVTAADDAEKRYEAIRKAAKDKVKELSDETREFIKKENPGVGRTASRGGESFHNMREYIRDKRNEAEYVRRVCLNACESKPDIDPHKRKCQERFRGLVQQLDRDTAAAGIQVDEAQEAADQAGRKAIEETMESRCGEKCKTDPAFDIHNPNHPYYYPGRERITEMTKVDDRDLAAIYKMEKEAFVGERSFQVEYNGQTEWVTVRRNERGVVEFDWDRSGFIMDQRANGFAASGTQYRYGEYRRRLERNPSSLPINWGSN